MFDIFRGIVHANGAVEWSSGVGEVFSTSYVVVGVHEIIFNEDRLSQEVFPTVQCLMDEDSSVLVEQVGVQFFRVADGAEGYRFGIRSRFFNHSTRDPVSTRFHLVVQALP
jgi:hypothetical protein